MKKKILGGLAIMAIAAISALNVNFNIGHKDFQSEIFMANIEALAQNESGSGKTTCYHTITSKDSSRVIYCGTCTYVDGTDSWISGTGKC